LTKPAVARKGKWIGLGGMTMRAGKAIRLALAAIGCTIAVAALTAAASAEDLHARGAYLRSLKPVK
jgi:hypothetical protein